MLLDGVSRSPNYELSCSCAGRFTNTTKNSSPAPRGEVTAQCPLLTTTCPLPRGEQAQAAGAVGQARRGLLEGGSHHPPHWAVWGSSPLHLGDEHPLTGAPVNVMPQSLTGASVPPTLHQGLGWLKAGPSTPDYPHQARGADTPV